ncbi:hypothetical protein HYH03_002866 [Edaphochlamys debaryana]|uniref:Protein kinase domain-containing protein n=1 Tax=Edaphochlamys debaryana TaxID=47281 RepID=A0A836C4U4_9CHLO|nr:hypothetical protein HYH03_002866 [Edaphochlamys debaryana]|eukprot:KAG2499288.1 hypothetical protein HYH03_002866 [Edaphochlamys debaryana]
MGAPSGLGLSPSVSKRRTSALSMASGPGGSPGSGGGKAGGPLGGSLFGGAAGATSASRTAVIDADDASDDEGDDRLAALPVVPQELLDEAARAGVSLTVDPEEEVEFSDDVLGRGGSGTVFRATYRGQPCAVKVLPPEMLFGSGSAELHTFVQEVVVLASVRHPNIVRMLGGSLQPPNVFIIEELCCRSLDSWLHGQGRAPKACVPPAPEPMTPHQLMSLALDVATGLQYLHCRSPPIVHRDLKPANILIDANGTAKISDFGLARAKTHAVINTKAPEVGSIGYMAPECFTSDEFQLTDKVDTWSLGVILWEMVARKRPWPNCTLPEYFKEVVIKKSRLPVPTDDNVCPMALRRLISSCWAEDPEDRPDCAHIVAELSRLLKYTPKT